MGNHIDSFVVPAGVTSIFAQCWGGGGAGFVGINAPYRGPGGGGGAYTEVTDPVTPGQVISLLIPDATISGNGSQAEYGRGGSTTKACVAAGGGGAVFLGQGAGGTVASSTGDVKVAGVDGTGNGFGDFVLAPGNPGGAGANGGAGGAGGPINTAGFSGDTPGGGGGGGGAATPTLPNPDGGPGAAGAIRLWNALNPLILPLAEYGSPPPLPPGPSGESSAFIMG